MCKSTFYRKMQSQNGQKTFIFFAHSSDACLVRKKGSHKNIWYILASNLKTFEFFLKSFSSTNDRRIIENLPASYVAILNEIHTSNQNLSHAHREFNIKLESICGSCCCRAIIIWFTFLRNVNIWQFSAYLGCFSESFWIVPMPFYYILYDFGISHFAFSEFLDFQFGWIDRTFICKI